jgi:hypothetical protein
VHRRLKKALKARLAGADCEGVSVVELLYGAMLCLPGQPHAAAEPPAADFQQQLNMSVPCVATRPPPTSGGAWPPPALFTTSYVYIRAPLAAGVLQLAQGTFPGSENDKQVLHLAARVPF